MNTQQVLGNKLVHWCMSLIPDDAYTQTKYMYYLTGIVFLGLLGYAGTSWYIFIDSLDIKTFFSSLFMSAITLLSLFGVKQTRTQYLIVKELTLARKNIKKDETINKNVESVDDMKKLFGDDTKNAI